MLVLAANVASVLIGLIGLAALCVAVVATFTTGSIYLQIRRQRKEGGIVRVKVGSALYEQIEWWKTVRNYAIVASVFSLLLLIFLTNGFRGF